MHRWSTSRGATEASRPVRCWPIPRRRTSFCSRLGEWLFCLVSLRVGELYLLQIRLFCMAAVQESEAHFKQVIGNVHMSNLRSVWEGLAD